MDVTIMDFTIIKSFLSILINEIHVVTRTLWHILEKKWMFRWFEFSFLKPLKSLLKLKCYKMMWIPLKSLEHLSDWGNSLTLIIILVSKYLEKIIPIWKSSLLTTPYAFHACAFIIPHSNDSWNPHLIILTSGKYVETAPFDVL